jgi:hypothetical protein
MRVGIERQATLILQCQLASKRYPRYRVRSISHITPRWSEATIGHWLSHHLPAIHTFLSDQSPISLPQGGNPITT